MVIRLPLTIGLLVTAGQAMAEDGTDAVREKLLAEMRRLAEKTEVKLANQGELPELVTNPVFRYADQPRRFIDATVWVWTREGRPVAADLRNADSAALETASSVTDCTRDSAPVLRHRSELRVPAKPAVAEGSGEASRAIRHSEARFPAFREAGDNASALSPAAEAAAGRPS